MERTNKSLKSLTRLGMLILVFTSLYLWFSKMEAKPAYIERAGIFMIPADNSWTDADVKSALDRLIRERQLRVELAQLLEENK